MIAPPPYITRLDQNRGHKKRRVCMNTKLKAVIIVMILFLSVMTLIGLAAVKNLKAPGLTSTVVPSQKGPQDFIGTPAYEAMYTATSDDGSAVKAKADPNGDGNPDQDGGKVSGYQPQDISKKVDSDSDSDPEIDDGNINTFEPPSY